MRCTKHFEILLAPERDTAIIIVLVTLRASLIFRLLDM